MTANNTKVDAAAAATARPILFGSNAASWADLLSSFFVVFFVMLLVYRILLGSRNWQSGSLYNLRLDATLKVCPSQGIGRSFIDDFIYLS
jgi:hypothetical protein